jgi:hypothetical protein
MSPDTFSTADSRANTDPATDKYPNGRNHFHPSAETKSTTTGEPNDPPGDIPSKVQYTQHRWGPSPLSGCATGCLTSPDPNATKGSPGTSEAWGAGHVDLPSCCSPAFNPWWLATGGENIAFSKDEKYENFVRDVLMPSGKAKPGAPGIKSNGTCGIGYVLSSEPGSSNITHLPILNQRPWMYPPAVLPHTPHRNGSAVDKANSLLGAFSNWTYTDSLMQYSCFQGGCGADNTQYVRMTFQVQTYIPTHLPRPAQPCLALMISLLLRL